MHRFFDKPMHEYRATRVGLTRGVQRILDTGAVPEGIKPGRFIVIPKPTKKIKESKPLTRKTPIVGKSGSGKTLRKSRLKQQGKVAQTWTAYRAGWLNRHPPDWKGNYSCGICGQFVHVTEVTLDHILPRSRRPDLRYTDSNIQPVHLVCNGIKGST